MMELLLCVMKTFETHNEVSDGMDVVPLSWSGEQASCSWIQNPSEGFKLADLILQ